MHEQNIQLLEDYMIWLWTTYTHLIKSESPDSELVKHFLHFSLCFCSAETLGTAAKMESVKRLH